VLRVKEGQPARIEVANDSGYPNLIHSHGLMIPSVQGGATEEESPIIEPNHQCARTRPRLYKRWPDRSDHTRRH
jgi:hypothetical protein